MITLTKAEKGSLAEAICKLVCAKNLPDKYSIEEAKTLFEAVFAMDRMCAEFEEGNFNRIIMSCGSSPTPIEFLVKGIEKFYGKYWRPAWADDKVDFYEFKEVSIEWPKDYEDKNAFSS